MIDVGTVVKYNCHDERECPYLCDHNLKYAICLVIQETGDSLWCDIGIRTHPGTYLHEDRNDFYNRVWSSDPADENKARMPFDSELDSVEELLPSLLLNEIRAFTADRIHQDITATMNGFHKYTKTLRTSSQNVVVGNSFGDLCKAQRFMFDAKSQFWSYEVTLAKIRDYCKDLVDFGVVNDICFGPDAIPPVLEPAKDRFEQIVESS